ncbi:gamma-glutamyltransferase [Desulfosarcina sp.]|uniref:gamma-glutamyltransferase n=1 Tax=Desulfosarcina sp. TaxID=2027861 RepID=UPI003564B827
MKKYPFYEHLFRWQTLTVVVAILVLMAPAAGWGKGKLMLGVPGVKGGVVTTSEPNAARVGAEILKSGGNAIDAAAAVQFALNVVEPQSSGIGGGGFMVIYLAKYRKTITLDSREKAPGAATADMFEPFIGNFGVASTSGLAVGVPGTLLGVATALEEWGTIELSEALAPAIALARDGFRVGPRLAESTESSRLQNETDITAYGDDDNPYDVARKVFRPGNLPLEEGTLLLQPDLARTFQLIADEGTDVFYSSDGEIAKAIIETQLATRTDGVSEIDAGIGRMTLDDLANYDVAIRRPVSDTYRGYTIKGMGPPSSGALTVLQMLKMMERFPIGDADEGFGFGSTRTLNVMLEAGRLAFADRSVWMGDEDFVDVPKKGLLDDDYIAMRSALIDPDSRQDDVEADDPRPFESNRHWKKHKLARVSQEMQKGVNTTHFSIVDRFGNVVSYTTTIESGWGTGLMVPGYGFLLNNELTDFNFAPAFNPDPDNFNPGANDVAANKRPRSSMSPTIVFNRGKPVAAYGSPGGSTIINSVVNVTMNLIDHQRNIQEAIDLPRISQTSANGSPNWEAGFSQAVIDELKTDPYGHNLADSRLSVIGSVQGVVISPFGKLQYGGADRRRVGGVVSVRLKEIDDCWRCDW